MVAPVEPHPKEAKRAFRFWGRDAAEFASALIVLLGLFVIWGMPVETLIHYALHG